MKYYLAILSVIVFATSATFVFAAGNSNFSVTVTASPECDDDGDNDSDGLTDFPDDPDCESAVDTSESEEAEASSGSSGSAVPEGIVQLQGYAYANQPVVLLLDGRIFEETTANSDGAFEMTLQNMKEGVYLFSLYAVDGSGRRSNLYNFFQELKPQYSLEIFDIMISPTIFGSADFVEDHIQISVEGTSTPRSEVAVVSGVFEKTVQVEEGTYSASVDVFELGMEEVSVYSVADRAGLKSNESILLRLPVGETIGDSRCPVAADLNNDCRVNLVDFSIAAYWYGKELPEEQLSLEKQMLSGDGRIDLTDFSLLAFYWTG